MKITKKEDKYIINENEYSVNDIQLLINDNDKIKELDLNDEEITFLKNEIDLFFIKDKKDLHLFRKFFHAIPGIVLVYLIQFKIFPTYLIIVFLGLAFLASVVIESIRIKYKRINDIAVGLSKYFIRKEEIKELSGVPFYLAGCFISLLAFGKDIASLSILYLAIGDPIASTFGILFGENGKKIKNNKSLIGLVGNIAISICITILYGTIKEWDIQIIYQISLFGGLISGFTELLCPEEINDNFFIPVVSALLLSMVFSNFMIVPK